MATNNNLKFEKIVNVSIDDLWHGIISYIILVKNSNEIT